MDIAAVDQTLRQLAVGDEKYAAFRQRIVNTNKRVYGVRTPALRHLAKQLARYGIGAAGGDGNNETPPLIYEYFYASLTRRFTNRCCWAVYLSIIRK